MLARQEIEEYEKSTEESKIKAAIVGDT